MEPRFRVVVTVCLEPVEDGTGIGRTGSGAVVLVGLLVEDRGAVVPLNGLERGEHRVRSVVQLGAPVHEVADFLGRSTTTPSSVRTGIPEANKRRSMSGFGTPKERSTLVCCRLLSDAQKCRQQPDIANGLVASCPR